MVKQWLLKFSGCVFRRGSCLVIFATALMVVTAGLWMARQSGREVDIRMRRDLARQAADIAAAVNPVHMEYLSFTADDKDRPVFKRLSSQMRDYAGFTGVKNIYTMALRNGQIVFGPESLPEGHPYASPPGTVYQEPSQKDFDIFTTGRPQVQGPVSDEYGTFVTASAPVFDPYSGEVVAVIGIDVEASVWRAAVRRAQWLPAQLTLILLLILLLSGLIIRYRQHHSPERKERRRYTETILSSVFLGLLTLVVVCMVSQAERESRYNSFYQHAQTYAAARVEELNDLQDRLDQVVSFFESSKNISREEFSSYCNSIVQDGVVTACVWLPAVTDAEGSSFVQKARDAGWPDFSIWQKNKNGFSEPVALRPVYYPALYIAPLAGHEAAVGYDLNSEPLRQVAIKETLLTGLPTATDPIRFITLTNTPLGFFIFQPVNASVQQGLAAFAVRPENLLGEAPHHNKKKNLGIEVCIFQLKPRGESVFMAGSYGRCGPVCFENEESGLGITVPVFRFGKTYAMRLTPDEVWLADHPLRQGWIAGLIGLLITFLFSSVVALITNRHATLERMVDRRTAELSESEAALQLRQSYLLAILENQNGRVWLKDIEGRFLAVNHAFVLACGKQSKSDIVGKTSFDVWPAETAGTYHKDDLLVIEKGTSIVTEEVYDTGGRKQWFETYKAPVFSAHGEVLGTTGYARDITDRKQAEERIRQLAQHLQDVREDERKRLSRELHDDLGQILTALKIDLLVIKDECTCSGEVKAKMGDMQTLLRDAIQSVHSLCRRLRPGALDDLDIEDALAGLIEDWKQRNRITCDLFVDVDDKMLSDEQKTAVFRMVQESLTNVSRYADATRVEISLVADEKEFHFSVVDNGCGMDPEAVNKPTSFGLLGMRERMEALGGSLHIESSPGKGTRIEGTIPLGSVKKLLPPDQDESGGQPGDSRGV